MENEPEMNETPFILKCFSVSMHSSGHSAEMLCVHLFKQCSTEVTLEGICPTRNGIAQPGYYQLVLSVRILSSVIFFFFSFSFLPVGLGK